MTFLLRAVAGVLLLTNAGSSIAEGLSFAQAIAMASQQGPTYVATVERIAAARNAAISTGALPDPKLLLGIDNLPIDGVDQFSFTRDFMTMQRIGVMQEFLSRAKRVARSTGAQARIAVAEAESRVTRLIAIRETAVAWIARETAERQLNVLESLVAENRLFEATLRARVISGLGLATDTLAARQVAAILDERRDELRSRREQATATLRQWLGSEAAGQGLVGNAPEWPIEREVVYHQLQHHPEFAVTDAQARVLDAQVAEAQAAKRPDWSMEVAYQRRGPQFSNMMSLQFSIDLPVFAGSRQDPQVAARHAERRALAADREVMLRQHEQMLESGLAEYLRLTSAIARQRDVLVPLAGEKVMLAMSDWRSGKSAVTEVIAARREQIDAGLRLIALEGERRQLSAGLHYTYDERAGDEP